MTKLSKFNRWSVLVELGKTDASEPSHALQPLCGTAFAVDITHVDVVFVLCRLCSDCPTVFRERHLSGYLIRQTTRWELCQAGFTLVRLPSLPVVGPATSCGSCCSASVAPSWGEVLLPRHEVAHSLRRRRPLPPREGPAGRMGPSRHCTSMCLVVSVQPQWVAGFPRPCVAATGTCPVSYYAPFRMSLHLHGPPWPWAFFTPLVIVSTRLKRTETSRLTSLEGWYHLLTYTYNLSIVLL